MSSRKCLEVCPRIVECRERLFEALETPAPADSREVEIMLDHLVAATARVALSDCIGPSVEGRVIEKGGYWQSKKLVSRGVYVCGDDGYSQKTSFYREEEKMPPQ